MCRNDFWTNYVKGQKDDVYLRNKKMLSLSVFYILSRIRTLAFYTKNLKRAKGL